jgi:magnesium-transporting ATPase (P-type)
MKENDVKENYGLESICDYETRIPGGVTFKQIVDFVGKILFVAEQAEKYWPSFKDGFKRGWEAA